MRNAGAAFHNTRPAAGNYGSAVNARNRYPLCFQAYEEPFHQAVIPAISPATQALLYLISQQ